MPNNLHALVLCGGQSRRMGADKAMLDFHGETMLARVVRLLSTTLPQQAIACVAGANQTLPRLPEDVRVVRDRQEDSGPLEGLAAGLRSLAEADSVFVTTCDAPLLVPELPKYMASLLADREAVVPSISGQLHPLSAVYRPQVAKVADERIGARKLRVIDFVAELDARLVDRELRQVDSQLLSLKNCNAREEYEELLAYGEASR